MVDDEGGADAGVRRGRVGVVVDQSRNGLLLELKGDEGKVGMDVVDVEEAREGAVVSEVGGLPKNDGVQSLIPCTTGH